MLRMLRQRAERAGVANVRPVLVTQEDPGLPPGAVDLILMVDVYHELPKPSVTLAQIADALVSGGRLALVEYRAEDPKVTIKPEHKMTLEQIRKELGANGWTFLSSDESLPQQRIVTFQR